MADILIRNVDPKSLNRLKARAKRNGRSLQSEAKLALERLAGEMTPEEMRAELEKWQKHFANRKFSRSSVDSIREDRER